MSMIGDIAAMGVEKDQLAHARPVHALADFGPGPDRGLGRKGERAGKGEMLVRLADRLDRQHEDVEILRYEAAGAGEIALVDEGVDADGQVRPVLLDRGRRAGRRWSGACRASGNPRWSGRASKRAGIALSYLADPALAATTSTSTLNSGLRKT